MKRLTIISHTRHYLQEDGTIVGWGATVTEINHLLAIFDHITHVAMLYDEPAPSSALSYRSEKIKFIPIPCVGGNKVRDKLSIITKAPKIIKIISKALSGSDYFQFRAPTGIGVFVIPFLVFFIKNKGWFKYAGNWEQKNAPLAYQFQKWLLKHQARKVTINGFWKGQPKQSLSFENPCLTEVEVVEGKLWTSKKSFEFPINFCFVGRLESAKGLDIIFDAIGNLNHLHRKKIGVLHLVGDGAHLSYYQKKAATIDLPIIFHGVLSRKDVHTIYKNSDVILLPSLSEGFPKVISEAMNYGCVPIVSNVSSIGHYIVNGKNGFLLKDISPEGLTYCLLHIFQLSYSDLFKITENNTDLLKSFTYENYNKRLLLEIL